MKTRLNILQEDLKYYEDFIFELSKYNREFAYKLTEALAANDPDALAILDEGIGTAAEVGAKRGEQVAGVLGLKGRVSDFLMLKTPFKVAGAAAGVAAHAMGSDVGKKTPETPKPETAEPHHPLTGHPFIGGDLVVQGGHAEGGKGGKGGEGGQGGEAAVDSSTKNIRNRFERKSKNTITSSYDMELDSRRHSILEKTITSIDQKLGESILIRSAEKISEEVGREISPQSIATAATILGQMKTIL